MLREAEILEQVRKSEEILITSHVPSDGDSIGSQLAFHQLCKKLGKTSTVMIDGEAPPCYLFLPFADEIRPFDAKLLAEKSFNLGVCLDCGKAERLLRVGNWLLSRGIPVINIDHHKANERYGTINWVEPHTASVGEMVYKVFRAANIPLDAKISAPLYAAMLSDTGGFSNTTPETHRIAGDLLASGLNPAQINRNICRSKTIDLLRLEALVVEKIQFAQGGKLAWTEITREMCRATKSVLANTHDIINIPFSLAGVHVAVLFREMEGDEGTKVSLRSDGCIDVNQFASNFQGGGHTHAAGFTVEAPLEKAKERVLCALLNELDSVLSRRR